MGETGKAGQRRKAIAQDILSGMDKDKIIKKWELKDRQSFSQLIYKLKVAGELPKDYKQPDYWGVKGTQKKKAKDIKTSRKQVDKSTSQQVDISTSQHISKSVCQQVNKKRATFYLEPEQILTLERIRLSYLATGENIDKSELVRWAINDLIKKHINILTGKKQKK